MYIVKGLRGGGDGAETEIINHGAENESSSPCLPPFFQNLSLDGHMHHHYQTIQVKPIFFTRTIYISIGTKVQFF